MGIKKLKFKPLFLIYIFICIYFGWFNYIFYYITTIVLHEYAHYYVAKIIGYDVGDIVFNLYGAGLNSNNCFKPKHDIIISLAGPVLNLFLIILIVFFWWVIPSSYVFTYDFMISNLVVMIFNLLPIYPLDGGRIILALFSKNARINKLKKINKICCFIFGIFFLVLFGISIFYVVNYSFLFMGLFLSFNGIWAGNEKFHDAVSVFNKKYEKPLEVKIFKIKKTSYSELMKKLSPHYYSIFEYLEGDKWIRITEDEILKIK